MKRSDLSSLIKEEVQRFRLKEDFFDNILTRIGNLLKDKKAKEIQKTLEKENPELKDAIVELNQAYENLVDLMNKF